MNIKQRLATDLQSDAGENGLEMDRHRAGVIEAVRDYHRGRRPVGRQAVGRAVRIGISQIDTGGVVTSKPPTPTPLTSIGFKKNPSHFPLEIFIRKVIDAAI